jgi:hypothetical protein
MHAQRNGWEIQRQKPVQQMTHWVVVVGDERVRDSNAVVPALVPVRQLTTAGRVEQVGVDVVLEDLLCCQLVLEHFAQLLNLHFSPLVPSTRA